MLHFSGIINKYKLKVIETTGPKIILYSFYVLLLEIVNILISLPAYAFISSKEFAGGDASAIRTYRLRRIASLSVIAGMAFSIFVWILVSFFGLVLFPGKSYAAVASWDFNTPLAYNYDTTKIQITDGTAIFKATPMPPSVPAPTITPSVEITPTPVSEPVSTPTTPTPAVEPTHTPAVAPAPIIEPTPAPAPVVPPPAPVPTSPLLFNNLRNLFKPEVAYAQTNTCSAILQTITPLIVTPFVKWTGFSETANKNGGEIYYALSGDGGQSWLYFDGSNWSPAIGHGNTASEINNHISNFPITLSQTGAGTLMFKATFESDCTHDVSLLSLTADYQDQPSVIASFTSSNTSVATTTTVVTSEANPAVIAVTDSISASTDTSTGGSSQTEIPVINTPLLTETTNTTSLNTNTGVEVPSDISGTSPLLSTGTPTVGTEASTSLTTDTSLNTNIATPIAFSVHIATKTTGTPGHTLYSIPGLFSLSEGPDNGLVLHVTGANLQTTTLSSGANANVSVGDHIVVLVYDGSKLSLYIDGVISGTLTAPIVIAPPTNVSTSIGCVSAGFVL